MIAHVVYLDQDASDAKRREFARVAERLTRRLACTAIPAHDGAQLLAAIERAPQGLDHLVVVCHGGPAYLLRSTAGAHVSAHDPPRVVDVAHLAEAIVLRAGATLQVSLCSCLCGRSPHWYLSQLYGRVASPWGPESYRAGGPRSFAAALRDSLVARGIRATVRAHTSVGHVTANPLIREFRPELGDVGHSLFGYAFPGAEPTLLRRRRWVAIVGGSAAERKAGATLAERLILHDDTAIPEVIDRWGALSYPATD